MQRTLIITGLLVALAAPVWAADDRVTFVPSVDYKSFLIQQTVKTSERRERVINILLELLRMYPENLDKAQLKFRLAQLYLDKARYLYFLELYKNDPDAEKILKGELTTQKKNLNKLQLNDSYSYNRQAIAIYQDILKNYPKVSNRDEVLFYYAYNLGEVGSPKQAQALYNELVQKYPKSRYVAEAYLVQAEYSFYANRFSEALPVYQRVLRYQDAQVKDLAQYKIAWCYFNLGRISTALKSMEKLTVVRDKNPGAFDLREEALRDLVIMFSYGGYYKEAPFYFKQVGGTDKYRDLLKQLASLYYAQGKNTFANELYKRLINEDPGDKENPEMQKRLVEIAKRLGKKEDVVVEVSKLVRFYSDESNWSSKNRNDWTALQQAKELSENTLRDIALSMHNEAQKTKDDRTYALAMASYREYLDHFPEAADANKIRFYYAESLYKLGKFEQAAIEYTKVVVADPAGTFALRSGYGAIVSYDEINKEHGTALPKKGDKRPTLIPLWERETVKVADNYVQYFPQDRRTPQIAFKAAKVFYDRNHFKEAVKRFDQLVIDYPGASTTEFAVNLVLDSWNIQERWDEVVKWGKKYYANPGYPLAKRPYLAEIIEKASFKVCRALEESGKYNEAAQSYIAFANEYKKSEFADDALNNAAVSYHKGKDAQSAIDTYKQLIQQFPTSNFVQNAILAVGKGYEDMALFANAAGYYELYQQRYPTSPNSADLIYNAGVFRENLNQLDKAISNYRIYIGSYKQAKDVAATEFNIPQLLEKQKQYSQAAAIYSQLANKYRGQANYQITAMGRWAQMVQMAGDKNRANGIFRQTLSTYRGYAGQKGTKFARDTMELVSEAHFRMIDPTFIEYARVKLTVPLANFPAALQRKIKLLDQLVKDYQQVLNYNAGLWSATAVYRMALAYDDFAMNLGKVGDPTGLSANEKQLFKQQLQEIAQNMKAKAVEAYGACIERAAELDVFDPMVAKAEKRLGDLSGKPKTEVKEFIHEPIHTFDTIGRGTFL